MFFYKTLFVLFFSLFFNYIGAQGQINLNFRFKTGATITKTQFDAQHDKIPQIVGHYNTVKFITEQATGELLTFEDYMAILDPKTAFIQPTIFVEANLEFQQLPIYALVGCGNSQYAYNAFAWWYGVGIAPRVPIGYPENNFIVLNFEARRHTDAGFDEDAIIDSFKVNEKFKDDMRSFFSAPNSLGTQKAWIGYASVNYERKLKGNSSVMVGPFLAIDFSKDIDRPAGVNMSCVGVKAAFCIDMGRVEPAGSINYFNPFSR